MIDGYEKPGPRSSKKTPGKGGKVSGAAVTPALPGSQGSISKPPVPKGSKAVQALFQTEVDVHAPVTDEGNMDVDTFVGDEATIDEGADDGAAQQEPQQGDKTREKRYKPELLTPFLFQIAHSFAKNHVSFPGQNPEK